MATAIATRRQPGPADTGPQTVHLIDIGSVAAVPAVEIAAGGRLMGNYGMTTTVEYVDLKGGKSLDVIERDNKTGQTYRHIMRRTTLVAYFDVDRAAELLGPPVPPVDDVLATGLRDHIGREISTPEGWRRLSHVYVGGVGVYVRVAGVAHRLMMQVDQVVGVRGEAVSIMRCGCLEITYEQVQGHYPPCPQAAGWTSEKLEDNR